MTKIDFDILKMNYALVRTKLALQRTIFISLVSLKAAILYAVTKRYNNIVLLGLIVALVIGYQYYFIIKKLNNAELIGNAFFDWVPLLFLVFFFGSVYVTWYSKK